MKLSKKNVATFNKVTLQGQNLNIAKFEAVKLALTLAKSEGKSLSKTAEIICSDSRVTIGAKVLTNNSNLQYLTIEQIKQFTNSEQLKRYAQSVAKSVKTKTESVTVDNFKISESANVVKNNDLKVEKSELKKQQIEAEKMQFANFKKTAKYNNFLSLGISKENLKLILKFADLK